MTRRLGVLAFFLLILAGCAGSGDPETFDAQPGPLDSNWAPALAGDVDIDAVPLVQRNFLEGCIAIDNEKLFQELRSDEAGLIKVCGCLYDGITAELLSSDTLQGETEEDRERDAFKRFKDLDSDLGDPDRDLDTWVEAIAQDCIVSESSLS